MENHGKSAKKEKTQVVDDASAPPTPMALEESPNAGFAWVHWPPNKNPIYRILTSKLWEARYRLYQRRSLQVNTRWKALDEIFKIHKPLHRSELQNFAKFRRTFFWFFLIFSSKCPLFVANFTVSRWNLMKFSRNFAKMQHIFQKLAKSLKIWQLEVGKPNSRNIENVQNESNFRNIE